MGYEAFLVQSDASTPGRLVVTNPHSAGLWYFVCSELMFLDQFLVGKIHITSCDSGGFGNLGVEAKDGVGQRELTHCN